MLAGLMPVTAEQTIWLFSFLGVHWLTCSWSQMEASSELLGLHHTQSVSMCLTTLLDSILFLLWIACCLLKHSPLCLLLSASHHLKCLDIYVIPAGMWKSSSCHGWRAGTAACFMLLPATAREDILLDVYAMFSFLWFSEQVLWLVRVAGSWKVRSVLYLLYLLYIM